MPIRKEVRSLDLWHEAPQIFSPLRSIDPDGRRLATLPNEPNSEELLELFRWIVFGRVFDGRMIGLQRQGRIGTIGSIRGHEGIQAGVALAMTKEDWLVGTYRDLLAYIVHGVPVTTVIDFYKGRTPGPYPDGVRALPIQVVVGAHLPHATGLALAAKLKGEPVVTVAICGDGATSEGEFHEALNFAGVYEVPAVFVIQNNGWAISVPRSAQTRSETLAQKAWAYGIPAALVDGNDPVAVFAVVRSALDHARAGKGPLLIEALTYRLAPHTTSDDPRRYRDEEEVRRFEAEDPLPRLRRFLTSQGLYREGLQEEYEAWARNIMTEAIAQVEAASALTPAEIARLTYRRPPAAWVRRMEAVMRAVKEEGR